GKAGGGLPAVVAKREPLGLVVLATRGIRLKEQVGPRDFLVEVLGELRGAGLERGAHALALGVADLPEPGVLEGREQDDQAQERRGDDHHRHADWTRHEASLARGFGRKTGDRARFYVLNNLLARA